jgi:hypothetical protein
MQREEGVLGKIGVNICLALSRGHKHYFLRGKRKKKVSDQNSDPLAMCLHLIRNLYTVVSRF